jgi:hypothetical protein
MNPSRVSTDIFGLLATAQANWPHDPAAGSEAVWTKWRELLGRYSVAEVCAALDAMARTHSRLPPMAELLSELRARRIMASARGEVDSPHGDLTAAGGYPPVEIDADYVIGPHSAAFAEMNADGWTTERLIECIRAANSRSG